MEDVKDFHDTHDSLSNWLAAKERMMTVLGPISSDSRMVQSQVQQVQVCVHLTDHNSMNSDSRNIVDSFCHGT